MYTTHKPGLTFNSRACALAVAFHLSMEICSACTENNSDHSDNPFYSYCILLHCCRIWDSKLIFLFEKNHNLLFMSIQVFRSYGSHLLNRLIHSVCECHHVFTAIFIVWPLVLLHFMNTADVSDSGYSRLYCDFSVGANQWRALFGRWILSRQTEQKCRLWEGRERERAEHKQGLQRVLASINQLRK